MTATYEGHQARGWTEVDRALPHVDCEPPAPTRVDPRNPPARLVASDEDC